MITRRSGRSLLRSPLLRVIMSRGTKDALVRFSTRCDPLNHRCLVIVFIEAARGGSRFPRFNAARGTALVTFSLTKTRGEGEKMSSADIMLRHD